MTGRISGQLLKDNLLRNGIDLAFETDLLYLDVTNDTISIKGTTQPDNNISINGTTASLNTNTDRLLVDANLELSNNEIKSVFGPLKFGGGSVTNIISADVQTQDILIKDNKITTTQSNSNLDLTSQNSTVQLSDLRVEGNLHADGNITADGTIQFGDSDTDSVVFEADVNSDIIPDTDQAYNLGLQTKKWQTLYTNLVNGQIVSANGVTAGGINFATANGNIFYVTETGDDTSPGDRPFTPLATIQEAISRVDASSAGPNIILVSPGTYQEITPIVVPNNVTIMGADLRNTIIEPVVATVDNDVFHLNGDSTIANMTIQNFYYDSVNNKGYAFRFAPNGIINARSPYIQNTTVITKGSVTSASDPRGYDQGDAGKGAWIDGAELNSNSFDASMLFHAATFITPGVDAVTMTNGVRVEWLSSFTYFATKGLYALRGTTGRTSTDGSTTIYGAELRSIGSANIYGNQGAVADGAGTLMYLINHNFAYIGTGKLVSNDRSDVIKANETVELNNGLIYYTSTDEIGTFRVGDQFFVNLEDGTTAVDISTLNFNTLTNLTISSPGGTTTITGGEIELGNYRFVDDQIIIVSGDMDLSPSGNINFTTAPQVQLQQNLNVQGDTTIGGQLFIGDQGTDTVSFTMGLDQNVEPNIDSTYNLGSPTKQWNKAYLSEFTNSEINIYDNVITTTTSNADLELRANGAGNVLLPSNDLSINQNLTVNGTTTIADLTALGNFTSTSIATNTLTVNGDYTGQSLQLNDLQSENIQIDTNVITTTISNSDLELRTNGTGIVRILNDFEVDTQLIVTGQLSVDNINANIIDAQGGMITDSASAIGNVITTTDSNRDLEIRNYNGAIEIQDNFEVTQDLSITGTTTTLNQFMTNVGTFDVTNNWNGDGTIQPYDYTIQGNVTTQNSGDFTSNGDQVDIGNLLFRPPPITLDESTVYITTYRDVGINNSFGNDHINWRPAGSNYEWDQVNDTTIEIGTHGGDQSSVQIGDYIYFRPTAINEYAILRTTSKSKDPGLRYYQYQYDIVYTNIPTSYVTSLGDSVQVRFATDINVGYKISEPAGNLILKADGDVVIKKDSTIPNFNVYGLTTINNLILNEDLSTSKLAGDNILFSGNRISTTDSDSDLEFVPAGTGDVIVPLNDVEFSAGLVVSGTTTLQNTTIDTSLTASNVNTQDVTVGINLSADSVNFQGGIDLTKITIQDNLITTKGNENLELRASGTGDVVFDSAHLSNNITAVDYTGNNVNIDSDFTTTFGITAGALDAKSQIQLDEILIDDNFITTTSSNADLELRANGTGKVIIDESVNVPNSFTVLGNTVFNNITISSSIATEFFDSPDIDFQDNRITTTLSNSDLELRASSGNEVKVASSNVQIDNNLNVVGDTTLSGNFTLTNSVIGWGLTGFSKSLDIDGNYAIVGADGSGQALIYNVTNGALYRTLTNPNAYSFQSVDDRFGWDVGISGNYAIVGARQEDEPGVSNSGKAYIFDITTGNLLHTLDNPNAYDTAVSDFFGDKVAISGNYAIVVAYGEDDADGEFSGKAYIFNVTTGNLLHTLDNPNPFGTSESDYFGSSVAISGNYAIVAARFEDDAGGTQSGKAYIYNVTTGALVHTLGNPNAYSTSASDLFAYDVDISGNYAIVGATSEDDAGGTNSGKAYIYNVTTGALVHTLDNPNAYWSSQSDAFGSAVAISGNYAIVSATGERNPTASQLNSGVAYIFDVTTGNLLYTLDNPNTFGSEQWDQFGFNVGISGNNAIVGSFSESTVYFYSGALFNFNGDVTQNGNTSRTGNLDITGNISTTSELVVGKEAQFEDILVDENFITTTSSNADLELRANGTGSIIFNEAEVPGNVSVNAFTTLNVDVVTPLENSRFETNSVAVHGNLIEATTVNGSIVLATNGSGDVIVPNNNVEMTQNLAVTGSTDIVHSAGQTFQLTYRNDVTRSSELAEYEFFLASSVSGGTHNGYQLGLPIIEVDDLVSFYLNGELFYSFIANDVTATVTPDTLRWIFGSSNSTFNNEIIFPSNLRGLTGSTAQTETDNYWSTVSNYQIFTITVSKAVYIDGTLTAQDINQTGNRNLTGNLTATGNLDVQSKGQFENIQLLTNVIQPTVTDSDLELRASGTGDVVFSESVEVTNNVTATNVTVNNITLSGTADINNMFVPIDIEIFDNVITTLTSNSNLELRTDNNPAGHIQASNITFKDGTISGLVDPNLFTPIDLVLNTDNVLADSTGALQIPNAPAVASSSEGDLIFDSTTNLFNGYSATDKIPLTGLIDKDEDTSVLVDNNNQIEFVTQGNINSKISPTSLVATVLQTNDIVLQNSTISSDTDFSLQANGTGSVVIGDISLDGTNINTTSDIEMLNTGTGYVKFADSNALRIPIGGTQDRPTVPQIGHTRYNTTLGKLEVYDGAAWVSAEGQTGNVTEADMEALLDLYTLVFA